MKEILDLPGKIDEDYEAGLRQRMGQIDNQNQLQRDIKSGAAVGADAVYIDNYPPPAD